MKRQRVASFAVPGIKALLGWSCRKLSPCISFLGVCLPVSGWSLGTLPPSPDGVMSLVLYWQHILTSISGTFCAVSSVHMIWFVSTREGDWKTRMRNGTCPCRGETGGREGKAGPDPPLGLSPK